MLESIRNLMYNRIIRHNNIKHNKDTITCNKCKKQIKPIVTGSQINEDDYYYEETCPECDNIISEE